MIVSPNHPTTVTSAPAHYCPVCLRRVSPAQVDRRSHHESCRSGDLDVALLSCPTCGLVLAAEVDAQTFAASASQAVATA